MGVIIPFMTVGWAITAIITVDKEVKLARFPVLWISCIRVPISSGLQIYILGLLVLKIVSFRGIG